MRQNLKQNKIRLFLTGVAMGAADVVPGVSGGTVAFISGIYEELISSIKKITSEVPGVLLTGNFKKAWELIPFNFLLPLGLGIVSAVVSLASLVSYLLNHQAVYMWSLFFGLTLASLFIVRKRVVKWTSVRYIVFLVSAVCTWQIVQLTPVETPTDYVFFFLSGAIAICAMILPGISGSFLLVVMGKYEQVLNALLKLDIVTLFIFALGCAVGIALFSRLLNWLFRYYHDFVVAVLSGILLGSLWKLWPWKETIVARTNSYGEIVPVIENNILPSSVVEVFLAVLVACVGFGVIIYLERLKAL